jgi:glycosyltransferase involved in cell wall biosynthesis
MIAVRPGRSETGPRLLFLITEDWYFWSHRLDLARAARDAGFEVLVATRVRDHGKRIEEEGFTLLPIRLRRSSRNPVQEFGAVVELIRLYRAHRPDLAHHVAMKPMVYGSLAARVAGVRAVVNAFAGMGYAFISGPGRSGLLRPVLKQVLRWALALPHSRVVFQNHEDCDEAVHAGLVRKGDARVIRGVGVDTSRFAARPFPPGEPVVVLAGRMLWDKGVGEFVEAGKLLRQRGVRGRLALVGQPDPENPASIGVEQLHRWHDEGVVEWWGRRDDMPEVLASAHVVALPSYREGLPKVLVEAAACARPIVATDVCGCREVVRHGENGLLVPVRDAERLARAIVTLLQDPALCERMGRRGRDLVVKEFSAERITRETMALYRELLGPVRHGAAGLSEA